MIVVRTPVRTSFIGGGTDFADFYLREGGCVLTSAIDKYVYVVLKERFDDKIYINYSKKEIVDDLDSVQHDLVREAMRITGIEKGVEVTTLADVPSEGTGLGSSSSITVALLHACHTYQSEMVTAETLAEEACRIEIDTLGRPIGKQDQYIAAFGDLRFITFESTGSVRVERMRMPSADRARLEDRLMLFDTNVARQSTDILAQQKANITNSIENLRQMKFAAMEARKALETGALDRFGELLDDGWARKKRLAPKITNPEIDRLYAQAREAGAIGGKITGAGGGGFLLFYCPPENQDHVRSSLRGLRELRFHLDRQGTTVVLNSGS